MKNDRDKKQFFRRCMSVPISTNPVGAGSTRPFVKVFAAQRTGAQTTHPIVRFTAPQEANKIRRGKATGTVVRIP